MRIDLDVREENLARWTAVLDVRLARCPGDDAQMETAMRQAWLALGMNDEYPGILAVPNEDFKDVC